MSSDFVNDEFEENENDSDLEGRLYAEIYFSNENNETGENFQNNCMKTIQDIKNASQSSTACTSEFTAKIASENVENLGISVPTNDSSRINQFDMKSMNSREQFLQDLDINVNLEKQVNLEVEFDNILDTVSNEDDNIHLDLQQKKTQSQKNKSKIIDKESRDYSPVLKSKQNKTRNVYDSPQVTKNSLTTPKSVKRKSKADQDSENRSKRRSFEHYRNYDDESSNEIHPVILNSRKSCTAVNNFPSISDGAMDILFPDGWRENKHIAMTVEKSKTKKKARSKSKKIDTNIEKDEVIQISSDSSRDDSDYLIKETPKTERRNKINKKKQLPIWLDISSDSDESILEVPVPPKPNPPIVHVKDSEPSSDTDDSSNGIYDLNSPFSTKQQTTVINNFKCQDKSDDSVQSSEEIIKNKQEGCFKENTEGTSVENSIRNCDENLQSSFLMKVSNLATKISNANDSELNCRNTLESSSVQTSKVGHVKSLEITSTKNSISKQLDLITEVIDSSNSDSPEYENSNDLIEENLILNLKAQTSYSSLTDINGRSKSAVLTGIERESNTEYNEYFELLNNSIDDNNPKPSTSKINKKSSENRSKKLRTSKEKTDLEYFFEPMSEKVEAYYNDSWGGEDFSIEEVQSKMSKNPNHWAILEEDWKPSLLPRQRYFLNKVKCTLCRQPGHMRANCPEPKKSPVCHMCGSAGHYETRCPQKICLTCGKKQNSYRKTCGSCSGLNCSLCSSRGHKKDTCPDLWRQYHHTISESDHRAPKSLNNIMKPSHLLICCNCTMRGHDYFTCKKYRWSPHHPTPSHVQNYVWNQKSTKNSTNRVEVIDLAIPCKSSETLDVVESESIIEQENSQVLESADAALLNSKQNEVKILFEFKLPGKLTAKQLELVEKERILLNNEKGANIKELIAGRACLQFLKNLCRVLECEICITVTEGSKLEMIITYQVLFAQRHVIKKIIRLWLRISDKEKGRVSVMMIMPNSKKRIISMFNEKFDEMEKEVKSIEDCYIFLKETSLWLKQNINGPAKFEFHKKRSKVIETQSLLVSLLYKQDYGVEKNAFSKLQSRLETITTEKSVINKNSYIWLFYYYHLIFPSFTSPDLVQMLNTYFFLNGREEKVENLDEIVFNENPECIEKPYIGQKIVNNEQADHNSHPNKLPSSLENNSNNVSQNSEQKRFTFNYPGEDFIPISNDNYRQNTLTGKQQNLKHFRNKVQNSPEKQRNKSRSCAQNCIPISSSGSNQVNHIDQQHNSNNFGKSPRNNFKKNSTRSPKANEKLKKEATSLMKKALQINIPHITKAAITIGNLINENKLQRKNIFSLKGVIKRHMRNIK